MQTGEYPVEQHADGFRTWPTVWWETSVIREGQLEAGTLLGGGKITWQRMAPQPPTKARIRRTTEFVEYGVTEPGEKVSWLPVVKLGARVGDSW